MIHNLRTLPLSEKDGAIRRDSPLQLAAWYRAQADRAGSLWIWEARLQRAEDLEAQARRTSNVVAGNIENPDHDARPRRRVS